MNPDNLATWPPSIQGMARPSFRGVVNRTTALPIALTLWALATVGDYVTTAEVGFTLFYVVPIGIAVWWRGIRSGLLLCLLSTASFLGTWIATNAIA